MNPVRDLFARVLISEGALVEPIEPEGLEVIAPPRLQQTLAIPEIVHLGFGAQVEPGAIQIRLESDRIESLGKVLGKRGAFLQLRPPIAAKARRQPNLERLRHHIFSLENATYRALSIEELPQGGYCMLSFRIKAVSDEERSAMISIVVNPSNGAFADHLVEPILDLLSSSPPESSCSPGDDAPATDSLKQLQACCERVLPHHIRACLGPFISGMERRMGRDLDRLHAYHTDLLREASLRMDKAAGKGKIEPRTPDAPENEKSSSAHQRALHKMDAIRREYEAKVADLRNRYAMTVEIELVQAVEIAMPVFRIELKVLRKKRDRIVHLYWNPLSKKLDVWPCEECGIISPSYHVTNDRLRIVCASCMQRDGG